MLKLALARLLAVALPSWRLMITLTLSMGSLLAFVLQDRGRGGGTAAVVHDPLAAFDQRSPGKRQPGALAQTKQRIRARLRMRAPEPGPLEPSIPTLVTVADICSSPLLSPGEPITPDDPFALSLTTPLGGAAGVSCFQPQRALVVPLAQVRLPLGTAYRNEEDLVGSLGNSSLPIQTVPEPGTWLMMIVGFFSAGWVLRYRRRPKVSARVACHA